MTARGKSAAVAGELPVTAGVIAVPVSVILHSSVVRAMASAGATAIPASYVNVFSPAELVLLALAGLVIGVAGALLPASWAARTPAASTLRAQLGQRHVRQPPALCEILPVSVVRGPQLRALLAEKAG